MTKRDSGRVIEKPASDEETVRFRGRLFLEETMTAMITIERVGPEVFRVTLAADIRIHGSLSSSLAAPRSAGNKNTPDAPPAAAASTRKPEFLTVEETADLLGIGRDKVYYLIRTGQLRSIKIGKLRRVSREWVTDFVEQLAAAR
jgi:excisionase family DNA binding protein